MPQGTKTIQRRIKSVSNTKKITKAMEMVAAAKMRKATINVLSTRPYSDLAWQVIAKIKQSKNYKPHPLLRRNKSLKKLVILITSDKGLCGGFNAQMFREIKHFVIASKAKQSQPDFIVLGKKGERFASRERFKVTAVFENLTNNPKFNDIKPIAKMIMNKFISGEYGKIYVAYTDYVSTLVQKPRVRQLLPIIKDRNLGETNEQSTVDSQLLTAEYVFEPQGEKLLKIIIPKILETQIYQAVLESIASEHSARMVAMRSATDAANEMVDDLRFTYNKIRQAGITREISEISAGKAALE
ncbi:MAG: ATP synthase F1 subunit gamma [Patescibacteria group bacterium]